MHPVTVFIERFRAAVSVHIGPCSSVFVQMCILLYYWENKMMMTPLLNWTCTRAGVELWSGQAADEDVRRDDERWRG